MCVPPRSVQWDSGYFRKIGNSRNRPICMSKISSGGQLRHSTLRRSVRLLHRYISSGLGLRPGLGLPPTKPDISSPTAPEYMQRPVLNNRSKVGAHLLAVGLEQQSAGGPNECPEPGESADRSVNKATSQQTQRLPLQVSEIGAGPV